MLESAIGNRQSAIWNPGRVVGFVIVAAAVSAVAARGQDPKPTMTVGTASATRGNVSYGEIQVPAGSDAALAMPVAVIHGAKPGKVVAFVAGSHGTEYASSVALTRLISKINPKFLTGTVIVAPLLNVASFEQMTVHTNPIDKQGMNRLYPGKADGTQTERALALVAQQIVEPSDVIVDLHGGDLDEDLRPYSYWTRTGDPAQDAATRSLVMAFGLDHIIVRDIDITKPAVSLGAFGLSKSKTVFIAEAGRSGLVLDADVNALVTGCLNVLGSLKMIVRPVVPLAKPFYVAMPLSTTAEKPGMFFAVARRDTTVHQGAKVGYMTDYLGRRTGDVLSPATGLITFIRGVPSTWAGATLVSVAPILTTVPAYKRP